MASDQGKKPAVLIVGGLGMRDAISILMRGKGENGKDH
jgi:hypothetical protein